MSNLIDPGTRQLGQFTVGPIALGCWRLVAMPETNAANVVTTALESGLTLVDNADVYGLDWGGEGFGAAESLLGAVLKNQPELRDKMILATKGGIIPGVPYDSGNLQAACEASLQRLNTDRIDLYQIHRPDMLTHPAEVARILEDLRVSGKILEVGVSNFTPSQLAALQAHLPFPIVATQPEYSALALDALFNGTFDQAMQHGINVLAWSPLGGGKLASTSELPADLANVLTELAERENTDVATIALAFALAHPSRPIAIVGTTNPERISQATKALNVQLDRTDVYRIIQTSMGEALP
ncbi:MAG: aldo/keto reductase family oxidoreductase [Pseudomonadales bacterium]